MSEELLLEALLEALLEFLNAVEAGVVAAKRIIAEKNNVATQASSKVAAVSEETFLILKFEQQKGARLGDYEVAYKAQNLPDKWSYAYNILRQANATIQSRYQGEGYRHSYWLYGEGKIYRQKLKPKT